MLTLNFRHLVIRAAGPLGVRYLHHHVISIPVFCRPPRVQSLREFTGCSLYFSGCDTFKDDFTPIFNLGKKPRERDSGMTYLCSSCTNKSIIAAVTLLPWLSNSEAWVRNQRRHFAAGSHWNRRPGFPSRVSVLTISMATSATSRASSISQHLHATKEILHSAISDVRYVWSREARYIGD